MMVSKEIILLTQTVIFNNDIREWRRQATNQKTQGGFKILLHGAHCQLGNAVKTSGEVGYTTGLFQIQMKI